MAAQGRSLVTTDQVPVDADERRKRLAECEAAITASHVVIARAIATIHNDKLYLESFTSFEDYLRERWGMARATGNRYVEIAAGLRWAKDHDLLDDPEKDVPAHMTQKALLELSHIAKDDQARRERFAKEGSTFESTEMRDRARELLADPTRAMRMNEPSFKPEPPPPGVRAMLNAVLTINEALTRDALKNPTPVMNGVDLMSLADDLRRAADDVCAVRDAVYAAIRGKSTTTDEPKEIPTI